MSGKSVFVSFLAAVAIAFAWVASPQAAPLGVDAFSLKVDSAVQPAAAKKIKDKVKSLFKKKKKKAVAKKAPPKKKRRVSKAGRCGTYKYWDRKKGKCVDARG